MAVPSRAPLRGSRQRAAAACGSLALGPAGPLLTARPRCADCWLSRVALRANCPLRTAADYGDPAGTPRSLLRAIIRARSHLRSPSEPPKTALMCPPTAELGPSSRAQRVQVADLDVRSERGPGGDACEHGQRLDPVTPAVAFGARLRAAAGHVVWDHGSDEAAVDPIDATAERSRRSGAAGRDLHAGCRCSDCARHAGARSS